MRNLKARDVMNKNVIYVTLPNTREKALEILKEHGISAVPVVKNDKVVGIVTRKDILRKVDENQLALLMTPNPTTVQASDSIKKVAEIFTSTPFRRLPVLEGNKLVGIITVRDLIKKIAEMNIDKPIKEYITPNITAVWYKTPLNIVGEIMRLSDAEICAVLDDNVEIAGIIDEKIMLTESLIDEFIYQTEYYSSSDTDDAWTWDGIRDYSVKYFEVSVVKLPKEPVERYMKAPVFVYPYTTISKCAREMDKNDVDHIPVLDSFNRLQGLVKDKDIIKIILELTS